MSVHAERAAAVLRERSAAIDSRTHAPAVSAKTIRSPAKTRTHAQTNLRLLPTDGAAVGLVLALLAAVNAVPLDAVAPCPRPRRRGPRARRRGSPSRRRPGSGAAVGLVLAASCSRPRAVALVLAVLASGAGVGLVLAASPQWPSCSPSRRSWAVGLVLCRPGASGAPPRPPCTRGAEQGAAAGLRQRCDDVDENGVNVGSRPRACRKDSQAIGERGDVDRTTSRCKNGVKRLNSADFEAVLRSVPPLAKSIASALKREAILGQGSTYDRI
jgi:hypothetical protein